jgi:hypothetical protein
MLDPEAVLNETRRLIEEPERQSHVTWVWGGTRDNRVVVVYRWLRESALRAYHRDVIEYGRLFDPVDNAILAEIVANDIEEPAKASVDVPREVIDVVPEELRRGLVWAI